jgi:amino acid permease
MAMGVAGASLLFIAIMVLSFATFGQKAQVLLLNNYHPSKDNMATIARLMIAMSLISGYSFSFDGLKTSLFSLLKLTNDGDSVGNQKRRRSAPAFVLVLIAALSCFVTDQGITAVIGIAGSIFGSIVVYIFPAIVNSSLLKLTDRSGNPLIEPLFPGEAMFNQGLFAFGVVFAALGSRLLTHPKERFRI